MHYVIYNRDQDRPSFRWHFIISTARIYSYRGRVIIYILCLFPLLIKLFSLWEISKIIEVLRSKLINFFPWEIHFIISYVNGTDHVISVLLNNLFNLTPTSIDLASGIALDSGMDYVVTRPSWWEDLHDMGRQVGWSLKEVVGKATPKYLNLWSQL